MLTNLLLLIYLRVKRSHFRGSAATEYDFLLGEDLKDNYKDSFH